MNKEQKKWLRTVLSILGILTVLYAVVSISLKVITRHNEELTVPDFTEMQVSEAQRLAAKHNLRVDVTDSIYVRSMERGAISKQRPAAGSKVKKGRRILLTINSVAQRKVEMPHVVGYSMRQAKTVLTASGLTIGRLIYVEDMATNNVLEQQYKGRKITTGVELPAESEIDLVLGLNPSDEMTAVPDVRGYKYLTAKDFVFDNSLNVSRCIFDATVKSYLDTLDAMVYKQSPEASDGGALPRGSNITLYLTKDAGKIRRD